MTPLQRAVKYCAICFAFVLIIGIFGSIASAFAGISFAFGSKKAIGKIETYNIADDIKTLKIDIKASSIDIVTGDEVKVESNNKYVKVKNKNGCLSVKEKYKIIASGAEVKVTLPKSIMLQSADIDCGAGPVYIENISAQKLVLDLGAGKANIKNVIAEKNAKIDAGAGKLKISDGKLHDLRLDLGVGETDLRAALTGDNNIDHGIGSLFLELCGDKESYKVIIDKGIGKATVDGDEVEDGYTTGEGDNTVKIDGGIGNMRLNFAG